MVTKTLTVKRGRGRPKKVPGSPVVALKKVSSTAPLMQDIMTILTCDADGEAKVAAFTTYRMYADLTLSPIN